MLTLLLQPAIAIWQFIPCVFCIWVIFKHVWKFWAYNVRDFVSFLMQIWGFFRLRLCTCRIFDSFWFDWSFTENVVLSWVFELLSYSVCQFRILFLSGLKILVLDSCTDLYTIINWRTWSSKLHTFDICIHCILNFNSLKEKLSHNLNQVTKSDV